MNKRYNIFDYLDRRGRNVMQEWANKISLQNRDRARLDLKIDMLSMHGDELLPQTLQSTKSKHILELTVNGKVALRPMLCRGPVKMNDEFTFLLGVTERDRKYVPSDALERAEKNRLDLQENPKNKRCFHEEFN